MATTNEDLDLAKEQDAEPATGGGKKKMLILAVAAIVLIAASAGGMYFVLGGGDAAEPVAGAELEGVATEEEVVEVDPEAEPIYFAMSPAFLINFEQDGRTRYLQIEMQVMSFDQAVIDKVEANMPAVRNDLILLLSDQDYPSLATVEGKDGLRKEVLDSINKVVRAKGAFRLENVYFTGFVVQ